MDSKSKPNNPNRVIICIFCPNQTDNYIIFLPKAKELVFRLWELLEHVTMTQSATFTLTLGPLDLFQKSPPLDNDASEAVINAMHI